MVFLPAQEHQHISLHGKTIFSFSKCSEKMIFPRKLRWNMILLVSSGKMIFLFPQNMILFFRRKMKDDLSQKIHGNMIFSSNVLKRWSFQKKSHWNIVFLVSSGKMVFLSLKNMIFFLRQKMKDRLNLWIHFIFEELNYASMSKITGPLIQMES